MPEIATRFITRLEIIKETSLAAYKQAIASKKLKVYKFTPGHNATPYFKRKQWEAYIETCTVR